MLLSIINDVARAILKEFDVVSFCVSMFYGLVGMLVIMLINANKRDVNKDGSPVDFSWYHLVKDNWLRILTNIVVLMVFIRFGQNALGQTLTSWFAFGLGLISDFLSKFLQQIAWGFKQKVAAAIDKIFGKQPEI